jgi:hypothetical protein
MAVELLLAALLMLTVVWCALVHQRLRRLRADKGEMEGFIAALTAVTERAEAAIAGLRGVGETTRQELERQESAARRRTEDLARAMDGAQRMLRRFESAQQQASRPTAEPDRRETRDRQTARPANPIETEAPPTRVSPPSEAGGPRPRISDELLRVLQGLR